MIGSLRLRLFLGTTLVSATILACLSAAIDHSVRKTLVGEFDRVLLEKARSLASMVDQHHDEIHFDYQSSQFPEFEPGPHAAYFEIFLKDKSYQRSPSLQNVSLDLLNSPYPDGKPDSMLLPDNRTGRRLLLPFKPNIEPDELARGRITPLPGIVAVAQDTADLDRTLAQVRLVTWSLCGAATLLTGVAMLLVAGRAVKPVRQLADQIESIRETDLSAVIDGSKVPTELAPIIERLNGLLGRLADAFTRERAFTADVAHELRTPLAGLLATLEVCRSRPRDAAAYQIAIDKSLVMLTRMQSLIENLLLLARADSGQLQLAGARGNKNAPEEIDLASLLQECWFTFHDAAHQRGLTFALHETAAEQSPLANADREFLRIVFHNLFDNAISYAQRDTAIEVTVGAVGADQISLEFLNQGHSLSPEDLPRLTDRFWRKDKSRTNTGLHAGLGLSLCQRLLSLQHGTLSLKLQNENFIATITLPAAAQSRTPVSNAGSLPAYPDSR